MKSSGQRTLKWSLVCCLGATVFLSFGINQSAQTKQVPAPTGHVNDFAGVIKEKTRQQLENILANVKLKTGIEFDVAIVESTGGQDISEFSLQLARDWNIGAFNSARKSLLLVLAVNEKTSLTRLSRSVQRDLPEGVLGEMGQRMRPLFDAGQFSEGLETGVQHFVTSLSQKLAFSTDGFDQTPPAVSAASPLPDESVLPKPAAANSAVDSSKPTDEAAPVVNNPELRRRSVSETLRGSAKPPVRNKESPASKTTGAPVVDDEAEAYAVELTLTQPVEARLATLKAFLSEHPDSKSKVRATELLVSAHAALGDERLKKGDGAGGVEQLLLAIAEAPDNPSEKLFAGVISQIPLNLYLRGEAAAATKAAQTIEARFGGEAKRLLAISSFYAHIEQGEEATRLATQAVQLAPDLAEAHQGLGRALHISLRLEQAMAEYKRALELDPNSKPARRSMADLDRAFGKAEEALALYRQQLEAEPTDKAARTGLILSLLDLGRIEEAKVELDNAFKTDPRNLTLLAGTAYWFAAHNDNNLALALGGRAVQIEPRYTWSQVALARALVAKRKPLEAERALRFARQYGRFPTLDYELASTLAVAGLYEEAAEILMESFSLKDGRIEAQLGGQEIKSGENFLDLLAPERRASIFQSVAADTEANAKLLKALLTFALSIDQETNAGPINEERAVAAAKEFASGDDAARVHRQLYAAKRLLQRGVGFQAAYELAEAARDSAEAGLGVPALTVAVQADEYREIRARAISAGGTPDIPEAPRNVLSNLLRGHIEEVAGWARFNQDRLDEAVDHLKRATSIFPEGTPSARSTLWRLGAALDRQDKKAEALSYYIKSYNSGEPDPVRRTVIEQLYRKVNGSLDGLDERIGRATAPATSPASPAADSTNDKTTSTVAEPTSSPDNTATATATPTPVTTSSEHAALGPAASASPTPSAEGMNTTAPTTPSLETQSPSPTPEQSPAPAASSPSPEVSPTATPQPTASTEVLSPTESQATSPTPAAPTASPEATEPSASPTPDTPTVTPATADKTKAPPETTAPERSALTITGRVRDLLGNPIANVVVVLISAQGTVLTSTTDEHGNYSFTVAPSSTARSYRVIPSKDGLTFDPVDRILPIANDDVKVWDFAGTPVKQSVRLR